MITLNISKDLIFYLFLIVLIFLIIKQLISSIFSSKSSNFKEISLEFLEENRKIINSYIERIFCETLYYFLNKDIKFDENSPVKLQTKFKYRNCIKNLMRPDIKIDGSSFKSVFMQRIYLIFVSEVPKSIKDLIYSFNSGYDINNYWSKKKKASISLYVFAEINNLLNKRIYQVIKTEEEAFDGVTDKNNLESIEKTMELIDANEYTKLCSFIYGISDVSTDNKKETNLNEGAKSK